MIHFLLTALLATAPLGFSAPAHATAYAAADDAQLAVSSKTAQGQVVTYQIVTNEIKAQQTDGSKVEVYRFDPGVYVVRHGDEVNLQIRGFKGHDHPVVLEGYNLQGMVRRNQTTTLSFRANKVGTFRLVCTAHADAAHEGPMEGYLVVVP